MAQTKFFSLSQITGRIQEVLQPHIGKLFWVKAEISSGRERGGSFYCDLVETDEHGKIIAQMRCTIWSRDLARIRKRFKDHDLNLTLDDGTSVGFQCTLQYSPQYSLSLKVTDADPAFALGELELKKKEILDRLKREGLLEPNKNIYVPALPLKIGLVTSKNSAACNDFIKTLKTSRFGFRIYLADALVQGRQAETSVLHALEALENLDLELVIIARGGGSKTDLFYLDNEAIARKIASYRLPVWTGIGHETDLGILDHVANRYFKTPTAVAEELVARFIEMKRHTVEAKNRFKSTWAYRANIENKYLSDAKRGIRSGTRKLMEVTKRGLKHQASELSARVTERIANENARISIAKKSLRTAPINTLKQFDSHLSDNQARYKLSCHRQIYEKNKSLSAVTKRFRADRFNRRIQRERSQLMKWRGLYRRKFQSELAANIKELAYFQSRLKLETILKVIEGERNSITTKLATIKAIDPANSLKRGFSLVYGIDGDLVKSIEGVKKHDNLKITIADGRIITTVNDIEGD
jgi:exodeoxyribonuclease VII large subunit